MICYICQTPIPTNDEIDWWHGEPIHDGCKSAPRYDHE